MGKVAYCRATGELVKLKTGPAAASDRKGKGKMAEDPDEMGLVGQDRQDLKTLVDLSGVKGSMLCEEMGKFCDNDDAIFAYHLGLGKTVEAIALILLNRHPLSTKRDDAGLLKELEYEETTEKLGSTGSPAIPTTPQRPDVRAAPKAGRLRQSIIDLTKDLDLSRSKIMSDWWQREKEAFKDATIHDPIADLHVNQVAVGPLPLGLSVTC
jgi:E3 ubiquitin-protein ligase SHPRH